MPKLMLLSEEIACRKELTDQSNRKNYFPKRLSIKKLLIQLFSMPYMSAVVNETFRLSSIIPGDVPHSTTAKTELGGYTLPKGTIIIPNIYQVIQFDFISFRPPNQST